MILYLLRLFSFNLNILDLGIKSLFVAFLLALYDELLRFQVQRLEICPIAFFNFYGKALRILVL